MPSRNAEVRNVAAIQILSGLVCIGLQVFLFVYFRSSEDVVVIQGNALFTLAVGSFGVVAGIFGCFKSHNHQPWISYVYLGTSLGVVLSSVLYFAAGYWDFYAALKESSSSRNNIRDYYYVTQAEESTTKNVEVHFWLQAGLFLCVVTLALFSLAGTAVVTSYRCRRDKGDEDFKSLLVGNGIVKE